MKVSPPRVKTEKLIKHFGGRVQLVADYFGIDRNAVYKWGEYIPEARAYQVKVNMPELVERK